jgi:hypothetical protein
MTMTMHFIIAAGFFLKRENELVINDIAVTVIDLLMDMQ